MMTRQKLEARLRAQGYEGNVPQFPSALDLFDWYNRRAIEKEIPILCEYLVLINPSGDFERYARQMKSDFGEMVPLGKAQNAQPHFTLAKLILPNFEQYKLLAAVASAALQTCSSRINIQGLEKFGSGVIYLKPVEAHFFTALQELLKALMIRNKLNVHGYNFPSTPHLTILRNLDPEQLQRCWTKANYTHSVGFFIADSIKVIRRPYEGTTPYYEIRTEKFTGLANPTQCRQNVFQQALF